MVATPYLLVAFLFIIIADACTTRSANSQWDLVLSEVAPASSFQNEWITLYNPNDYLVDAKGIWMCSATNVCEQVTCPSTVKTCSAVNVPAQGWLKIEFTGRILNQSGDSVRLFSNSRDRLLASMTYVFFFFLLFA